MEFYDSLHNIAFTIRLNDSIHVVRFFESRTILFLKRPEELPLLKGIPSFRGSASKHTFHRALSAHEDSYLNDSREKERMREREWEREREKERESTCITSITIGHIKCAEMRS